MMHWKSEKRGLWNLLALGVFVAAVLYCCSFVLLHPDIVRNRFTDAVWHIAAADEYAKTGVFAKDPFIADAPPFAQFGLMEFVNARAGCVLGIGHEHMFVCLIAIQVAVFLSASFLAGFLLRRRTLDGLVVAGLTFLQHGHHGVIGNGLPFNTALAVFYLLVVGFALRRRMENRKSAIAWAAAFGAVLGLLFALHAFTGLMALAVVGPTWGWRMITRRTTDADIEHPTSNIEHRTSKWKPSRYQRSMFDVRCSLLAFWAFAAGLATFLAVSWRWWLHHLALRPALARHNAHAMTAYTVPGVDIVLVAVAVVMVGVVWAAGIRRRNLELRKSEKKETGIPEFLSSKFQRSSWFAKYPYPLGGAGYLACRLAAFGLLLLLLCIPAVNRAAGRATSGFMAERICAFFPLGLAMAVGASALAGRNTARWVKAVTAVCLTALLCGFFVPRAWHVLKLQYYLSRTSEYNEHPLGFLLKTPGRTYAGKTILSDPWTSYHARGLIGTYAVSVPAGHASPAVNYDARDAWARRALREGPVALGGMEIAAVVVNRKQNRTATFAGQAAEEIVAAWMAGGWIMQVDTAEVAVLAPTMR